MELILNCICPHFSNHTGSYFKMLASWFRRQKGRMMQMVIVLACFISQAHHFVVKMKIVYINRRMRQDLQWERNSR